MTIDIASLFKAMGPAASIIFAAWIFMGFLQARYDSAVDRFRALVEQFRGGDLSDDRRSYLRDEILVYKRRCELMNNASIIGIASAIVLIVALIAGEIAILFPSLELAKYASAAAAFAGLVLVIVASSIVLIESSIIRRQLNSEVLDIPDLARRVGEDPEAIQDEEAREGARSVRGSSSLAQPAGK